jgi:hypothetical protein
VLHVVTLLWDANAKSFEFSRSYNEKWVDRLYRGFRRNLTVPFRFVCFTDRPRIFAEAAVEQEPITAATPDYGTCIEPYRLNEPMILVGLDTLVVGNCDHLAAYCRKADKVALPRDPGHKERACNGVALVPAGQREIYDAHRGENDMEWLRLWPHAFLDDLFPEQVLSYKCQIVKRNWPKKPAIIYFHGKPKMPDLLHLDWVRKAWKGK